MKKEIFSKINRKDYNNILEEILEKKDFSKDVKNLLLSMLYKVEMSYPDYAIVKRNVKNKTDFIQDIIKKIKSCDHIIFIKPKSEQSKELEENHTTFLIEKDKKTIKVYPNEKSLLYAINAFDNKRIFLPEKYNLLTIAFPELINEGNDINNVEIIRDFNAWSWNISSEEISDIKCNLIYQILQIMLGEKKLEDWFSTEKTEDHLEKLKIELEKLYDSKLVNQFLNIIYKLSILLCIEKNSIEKKRLLEEKEIIEKELGHMEDKKTYLSDLSNKKKKVTNNIKQIDKILNDKKRLEEEFEKRNTKLSVENQIFSLSHLTKLLIRDRKRYLKKIDEINNSLEPKNYIKNKQKFKDDYELIKDIDRGTEEIINEEIIELQKVFMKSFEKQILNAEEKKEIINLAYIFRYYLCIPYDKERKIKEVKELNKYINKVKICLISKLYELKAVNKITSDAEINTEILKFIFETKMISIENMVIELEKEKEKIKVNLIDIDILEESYYLSNKKVEEKKIKYNKKIKVFN